MKPFVSLKTFASIVLGAAAGLFLLNSAFSESPSSVTVASAEQPNPQAPVASAAEPSPVSTPQASSPTPDTNPIPPPTASTLPAAIAPGTPLADVVRLIQAGVDVPTILAFITNTQSLFSLDADKIISLKDEGAPNEVINAMLERDKVLYAINNPPAPATPVTDQTPPPTETTTVVQPAPEIITTTYFYETLNPYGTWVTLDGYGRCWRPTVVVYDSAWRPYCDRGHWVYTDCGWYWDSDYSWGCTFHYGRWFHHASYGWCWYPGTTWAPSWVTWRSDLNYCGWAPLPPFADYRPGAGFYYRGAGVSVGFDFGLHFDSFVFVSSSHFCDRRPREHCVDRRQTRDIYNQTTVINDFAVSGKSFVNHGIPANKIAGATHLKMEPLKVSSLPNAERQGWRGDGYQKGQGRTMIGGNNSGPDNHSHPATATGNNNNNNNVLSGQRAAQFNSNKGNPNIVRYDSTHHVNSGANGSTATTSQPDNSGASHLTQNTAAQKGITPKGNNSIIVYGSPAQHPQGQGQSAANNTTPYNNNNKIRQSQGGGNQQQQQNYSQTQIQPDTQQQFQQRQPYQQQRIQQQPVQTGQQSQQQLQPAQTGAGANGYSGYNIAGKGTVQNQQSGGQNRASYNNTAPGSAYQPRGAEQLQQRQYTAPSSSAQQINQKAVETGVRSYSQPSSGQGNYSQGQSQPRASSSGSGNGGGGNSNNGGGSDNRTGLGSNKRF